MTAAIISNSDRNIEESKGYILKTRGDFLALYYGDTLVEVYEDVVVSALPLLDREKFLSGVEVEDVTKLEEFLEDFY